MLHIGNRVASQLVAITAVAGAVTVAHAGTAPVETVGLTPLASIHSSEGFVDDAIAHDETRLVYVVADIGGRAVAHVVKLADGSELAAVDISAITTHPTSLTLRGDRLFVIGSAPGDDASNDFKLAAMITLAGKVTFRVGEANSIAVIKRDGTERIAVDHASTIRGKHTAGGTRHDIDLLSFDNGKRVGPSRGLELDDSLDNEHLGFHFNHWLDGRTLAVGRKNGSWDRKEDQRSPDVEGTYDVLLGKFVATAPISDLLEHRQRFDVMNGRDGSTNFVRLAPDFSSIELWKRGHRVQLELDQPLVDYDAKTLDIEDVSSSSSGNDVQGWFALQIDPVNPAAVQRKKADAEYWDLFAVDKGSHAVRRARILATKKRLHFGFAGNTLWVLERNIAFDRGGKTLTLYSVEK